jgi:hypothetical protein
MIMESICSIAPFNSIPGSGSSRQRFQCHEIFPVVSGPPGDYPLVSLVGISDVNLPSRLTPSISDIGLPSRYTLPISGTVADSPPAISRALAPITRRLTPLNWPGGIELIITIQIIMIINNNSHAK